MDCSPKVSSSGSKAEVSDADPLSHSKLVVEQENDPDLKNLFSRGIDPNGN